MDTQPHVMMRYDARRHDWPAGSIFIVTMWDDDATYPIPPMTSEYQVSQERFEAILDTFARGWSMDITVKVPLTCDIDALNAALDLVTQPKAA